MNCSRNPYSGRNCSGYRFMFKARSIANQSLFLPLEMKSLPQIIRLGRGDDPLSVFNRTSIVDAREDFRILRKKYDFDYWAVTEYFIRDINDPDIVLPLRLNSYQHYVIDIFRKRYFNRLIGRYLITKSFARCGLTTCIQAYILWMQTFQRSNNSYTCGASDSSILPLKKNLCRNLYCDIVPSKMAIYIGKVDYRAFFNSFRRPDAIRGRNLGFVHFADMSGWYDPYAKNAPRAYSAAVSAVLLDYFTLVVLEGNIPSSDSICRKCIVKLPAETYSDRIMRLSGTFRNSFFINEVIGVNRFNPALIHIDLDKTPL